MSRWLRCAYEISYDDFKIVANGLSLGLTEARIVSRLRALKNYSLEEAFDIYWEAKKQYELNQKTIRNDLLAGESLDDSIELLKKDNSVEDSEAFNIYYNNKDFIENNDKIKGEKEK